MLSLSGETCLDVGLDASRPTPAAERQPVTRQESAEAVVAAGSCAARAEREAEAKRARARPQGAQARQDRLRRLTSRSWGVSMERRINSINRFSQEWTAYFALADTPSVFEELDEWLRRRLRQVR